MEEAQLKELENLLSQLEPGFLPEPIFLQFARLSVTSILELVPLRRKESGEIEVLVTKRPATDPHWPNMFHTPGTVVRATDDDNLENAQTRVFTEIRRNKDFYSMNKVDTVLHTVKRGKELAIVYAVVLDDEKEQDVWLPIHEIESTIVDTQVEFIRRSAAMMFK